MSKKKKIAILSIIMVTVVTIIGIANTSHQSDNSTLYLRCLMGNITETNTNKIKRVENVINEVKEKAEVYVASPMIYGRGDDRLEITISKDGETHYYIVSRDCISELKEEYPSDKSQEVYWNYASDDKSYNKIKRILMLDFRGGILGIFFR